jgi:hypothetical protein
MILRLLKGRRMISGLFEKKRDAIPPHPAPLQALATINLWLFLGAPYKLKHMKERKRHKYSLLLLHYHTKYHYRGASVAPTSKVYLTAMMI